MKKGTNILENEDNVVDLTQVRKGLLGGPAGTDENWLLTIPKGSVFVCKRKNAPKDLLALDLFFCIDHKDTVSNLIQKAPTGQQADLWVNSLEFSRFYKFEKTIATVELDYGTEQSETTDGNSEGSLLPEGVADDASPQG